MGLRKCAFRIGIAFDMPRQRQENQVCETPGRNEGGGGGAPAKQYHRWPPAILLCASFPADLESQKKPHSEATISHYDGTASAEICGALSISRARESTYSQVKHMLASSQLSCQHAGYHTSYPTSCTAMEFRQVFRFSLQTLHPRRASSSQSQRLLPAQWFPWKTESELYRVLPSHPWPATTTTHEMRLPNGCFVLVRSP